jgi:hypothetical protein
MTPEERAAAIGAAIGTKTVTYSFEGVTYRVSAATVSGPTVTVTISAWTGAGGNRRDLPLGDGIFRFVNPPLMVPDGGTVIDDKGNPHPSFSRDDLAAAQRIVADAVIACATRNGWTP